MFGPKMGTYSLDSKSDPRFNKSWEAKGSVSAGIPDWIMDWIHKKVKEFGLTTYPDDLHYSFHKH